MFSMSFMFEVSLTVASMILLLPLFPRKLGLSILKIFVLLVLWVVFIKLSLEFELTS